SQVSRRPVPIDDHRQDQRRQHRGGNVSERARQQRRHGPAREKRDERQPRQVIERADREDHRPQLQRGFHRSLKRSASVPMTMPSTPAAIRLSFVGMWLNASMAMLAVIAASTVGTSRNSGATSAMKHSGTANS